LLKRVQEILPQLREKDTLGLWLNNYADIIVQRIPNDPRIVYFRAGDGQPYPDIKSHGKFKNIQDYKGYYLTVDDDIIIPNRYVEVMIEGIEAYHRKAYCTFHGGNFPLEGGKVNHPCPRRVCERRTFEQLCQKDELVHQVDYMKLKYPKHEILTDIGSGINFRGNLKKIIDYAINNKLEELVIAYKDRLCRIGYDLIEYILKEYSNTKIIIEKDEDKSPEKLLKKILEYKPPTVSKI
jgi:hypothetical protein